MKTCEGPLTDEEAKCYLDRYGDLAKLRGESNALGKAKAVLSGADFSLVQTKTQRFLTRA